MKFLSQVQAKYTICDELEITAANLDQIKSFLKKAIIPSLMLLGPVACGQETKEVNKRTESKIEHDVNYSLEQSMKDLKCDIQLRDDGSSTVTFLGKIQDPKTNKVLPDKLIISFDSEKEDSVNVEVKQDAKTERMQYFQNVLLDTLKESGRGALDKYGCKFEIPDTNPVSNF